MQFNTVFTLLAIAMTAAAAPTQEGAEIVARTGSCTATQTDIFCCNGLGIGILDLFCTTIIGTGSCSTNTYCCNANQVQAGPALFYVFGLKMAYC